MFKRFRMEFHGMRLYSPLYDTLIYVDEFKNDESFIQKNQQLETMEFSGVPLSSPLSDTIIDVDEFKSDESIKFSRDLLHITKKQQLENKVIQLFHGTSTKVLNYIKNIFKKTIIRKK